MIKINNDYIPVINKPYYINNEEIKVIEKTSLYIYNLVNKTLKNKLNNKEEYIKGNSIAILSSYTENDVLDNDKHSNIEIVELKMLIEKINYIGKECKIITLDENIIYKIKEYNPTGIYWRGNHSIKKDINISFKEIYIEIDKQYKQIPSFGSLFVSDNKSFLKDIKNDIKDVIPKTFNPFKNNIKNLIKDNFVVKPDNSCAGQNITFGKDYDEESWNKHLNNIKNKPYDWVLQEICELKKDDENNYFDIAVYISNNNNGKVEGYISRTSKNKIVNVGNGGFLKPVVLNEKYIIWKLHYIIVFIFINIAFFFL